MPEKTIDTLCIGNAIVDVLAHAEDAFLEEHGLTKGAMTLIDSDRAERLYAMMGPGIECSGGSAGNTAAGIAMMGGRAGYIGKVRDDQLGRVFAHDIRAAGVQFDTPMAADGTATARCLILVTPDAQRTMNTFLGACVELGPTDIDPAQIERSRIMYIEGYLWDPQEAKKAIRKAIDIARDAATLVSLTLSDPFCVGRYREEFHELVEHKVDILFANEEEIKSLYQTDDFETAARRVADHCEYAALTRSEKGSVVLWKGERHDIPAAPVDRVVDTTGAGDQYAAGFLHAFACGAGPRQCGEAASLAAAEVISHFGARPETDMKALIAPVIGVPA